MTRSSELPPAPKVVVLAPIGRDGQVICAILTDAGFDCEIATDVKDLLGRLDTASAGVLAEEAFTSSSELALIDQWLSIQEAWSDFPFVLLSIPSDEADQRRAQLRDVLGNITLLERPLRPDTLVRAVRSASRARQRQREAARLLDERARAEAERRVREERLRELFDNAADAIFITDSAGCVTDVNPAACTLLEAPREDLIGRLIASLIMPDEREDFTLWMARQTDGQATSAEWRMIRPRGRWLDTEISARVLSDGRWQAFARDIGDRRLAEEALRDWNETLEARVAERTAELVQTQTALAQAQKMEAVGQLTGGVAHDFNNLLMVISGGLEMLSRDPDPERRKRVTDGMRQAVERGAALTRQLLTFSRRDALKPVVLELDRRISAMSEMLERSLRGDIRVEMSFQSQLWPVDVDPTQLELAVLNLAVNARDAMPEGGTLRVRGENAPDVQDEDLAGDFVRIAVSDNGSGMSAEIIARVFEPFFTTKGIGKGSGLGLAQIYGFAKESGGGVRISSEVGVGTTVSVLLPRTRRVPLAADLVSDDSARIHRSARTSPEATVLLVEDDDEVAALVGEMIEQLGYDVTRVATGAAALGAMANGRDIDVVFSDILMPGEMSGADLAREIRRRRPDMPIVLTTGYDGEARVATDQLRLPVLRKPYRLEALARVLADAIQRRGTQDAGAGEDDTRMIGAG
ncbi:MAG: putative sensor histidine kinase with and Response regulator receiver domain [Hyphomicrobiales bacterium]|nr:putative sensor histidine kinase with and Response regulator receiver domain [Hyphomicrobiales bacterium]